MKKIPEPIPLFACGIFEADYKALPVSVQKKFKVSYLDSSLHMDPQELDNQLSSLIAEVAPPFVLLYGDCSPHLQDFFSCNALPKHQCQSCIDLWLGKKRYRELRRRGSFFLLYEWVQRWDYIFKVRLGFTDSALAQEYMKESASELVYLDTGTQAVPTKILEEASAFLGLPFRIEKVSLVRLEEYLNKIYKGLRLHEQR